MKKDYKVRLTQLKQSGGHTITALPTGERHVVVLLRNQAHLVEVDASVFSTNSSAPRPGTARRRQSYGEGCVHFAATTLCYADAHPEQKLLLCGHADTSGEAEHNRELSEHRSRVMLALIEGDRDTFGSEADGPHIPKNKKSDVLLKDRLAVLDWVADVYGWPTRMADNSSDYFATVRSFQRSYNERGKAGNESAADLKVDADFGPNTWRAVFDCYRLEIAHLLELTLEELDMLSRDVASPGRWATANKITACGETQPIDNPGRDAYRSQQNRRVEILFFDEPDLTQCPCFAGECVPTDCELYNRSFFRRRPVPGSPFFSKLTLGWPAPIIDGLPADLVLELSGAVPTQRQTLSDATTGGDTTWWVFEQHDRASPCSLTATGGGKTVVLWSDEVVNSHRGAVYQGVIEDLLPPDEPVNEDAGELIVPTLPKGANPQ